MVVGPGLAPGSFSLVPYWHCRRPAAVGVERPRSVNSRPNLTTHVRVMFTTHVHCVLVTWPHDARLHFEPE